jgi:uncharacterized membrane protein YgcG
LAKFRADEPNGREAIAFCQYLAKVRQRIFMHGYYRVLRNTLLPAERGRVLSPGSFLVYSKLNFILAVAIGTAPMWPIADVAGMARTAAQSEAPPPASAGAYAQLSTEQLDRVVAPIALYPDSLVAQILAASSFPTQIVDADQWLHAHPGMGPANLAAQVDSQPWDPSVKALLQFPGVLHNLSSNLGWTSELGDAYYNQPQDVMKSIQKMRKQAKKAGTLKPTPQLKVYDANGDVVIEPVDPNIVYVPAYDPWIVYGYPIVPWPGWVDVPGIWWDGPGIYFGVGFGISPFFGFGWGWPAWGLDWHHYGLLYHRNFYLARGPDFFNRGEYFHRYGGPIFYHPRGSPPVLNGRNFYRGFTEPRGAPGIRSGPFGGFDHGGNVRNFSARGQNSFGGFHGGGGGFRGGGARSGGRRWQSR